MTNCLNKTGSPDLSEADLRSFGRSTGLRLKGKDPEKYGSIVRALEAGCSLRELLELGAATNVVITSLLALFLRHGISKTEKAVNGE